MATLAEQLLDEETRPKLVDECVALIDEEVRKKKGIKATLLKGAYKTVKAIKRGFVRGVVDALLDDWVAKLEPYYAEHQAKGSGPFKTTVLAQRDAVAESLLEVTDERAETTKHTTAKKLYVRLRSSAKSNVEEALPGLADVVDEHLAA